MSSFLSSSRDLVGIAAGNVVQVVWGPLSMPLHLASSVTEATIGSCTHVVTGTRHLVDQAFRQSSGGEDTSSFSPIDGAIHHVSNAIPLVLQAADQIKDHIGGIVLGVLSPVIGGDQDRSQPTSAGEGSSEKMSFLDRLRIDYPEVSDNDEDRHISNAEVSKFLLRTDDLSLSIDLCYIDLSRQFSEASLTNEALDAMVSQAFALASTHPETALLQQPTVNPFESKVRWKEECSTTKLLRQKERLDPSDWVPLMEREVMVWSGKYITTEVYGHSLPLFLARGLVPSSPQQFMELLWDNSRTSEYNRFCVERINQLVVEEDCNGRGTKVVKSETRVPFTSLSAVLSTLMHVRKLESPDEGYIIVSRSLNSGRAGNHLSADHVQQDCNNEIIWGINLIRSVPGRPELTDLTCLSQVDSAFVPNFLAHRVGIMAVENCFNAVRSSKGK